MDVTKLTDEMLIFHFSSNKEEISTLYRANRLIEEEMDRRRKLMLDKAKLKGFKGADEDVKET